MWLLKGLGFSALLLGCYSVVKRLLNGHFSPVGLNGSKNSNEWLQLCFHLSLVQEKHDYKIVNILSDVAAQDRSLVLLPGVHFLSLAGQMEELSNKNCLARWWKSGSSLCDF